MYFPSSVSSLSKSFVHKQILADTKYTTTTVKLINASSGQRPTTITILGLSKRQIKFQSCLMWFSISHLHLLCSVARYSYNTCDSISAQLILWVFLWAQKDFKMHRLCYSNKNITAEITNRHFYRWKWMCRLCSLFSNYLDLSWNEY